MTDQEEIENILEYLSGRLPILDDKYLNHLYNLAEQALAVKELVDGQIKMITHRDTYADRTDYLNGKLVLACQIKRLLGNDYTS